MPGRSEPRTPTPPRPHDPRSRPARGTGTILVIGGTGLVGRAFCAALAGRGIAARALVRPGRAAGLPHGSRLWAVEGDLRDGSGLGLAMEGAAVVVHLAGLVRSADRDALRQLDEVGTERLVQAARGAGVARLIALSSDTVLRARRSAYAESKATMEAVLSASGLTTQVLRPPMILGAGSGHLEDLRRLARVPVIPWSDTLPLRHPVRVDDVASILVALLEHAGAGSWDLRGAEGLSLPALIGRVAEASGRRPPRTLRIADPAAIADVLRPWGGRGRSWAERIDGLSQGVEVDDGPARRVLSWDPQAISIPWLREQGMGPGGAPQI